MRRLVVTAAVFIMVAACGCNSADIRKVVYLEGEVARLEGELERAVEWGVDPSKVEIPEGVDYEIRRLAVYRPYLETAVSIFPGCLFPGLGAHAIGDPITGWSRLGEAYTGVGEFALGTGATFISVAAMCDGSGDGDGILEMFVYGVNNMVMGPVHYMEAWLGDVASTYESREFLAERVRLLQGRYVRFLARYEDACRSYAAGVGKRGRVFRPRY